MTANLIALMVRQLKLKLLNLHRRGNREVLICRLDWPRLLTVSQILAHAGAVPSLLPTAQASGSPSILLFRDPNEQCNSFDVLGSAVNSDRTSSKISRDQAAPRVRVSRRNNQTAANAISSLRLQFRIRAGLPRSARFGLQLPRSLVTSTPRFW